MVTPLLDRLYDIYLQRSARGCLYEVPICVRDDDGERKEWVGVWAQSGEEAESRALALVRAREAEREARLERLSLGLVLPRRHYRPRGIWRAVTSPLAVWRDPVYKNGLRSAMRPLGYRFGTLTRLAIRDLRREPAQPEAADPPTRAQRIRALQITVVVVFLWLGLSVLGVVFLALGLHPGHSGHFVLRWFNPYLVAGLVCLLVGGVSLLKCRRDYRALRRALAADSTPNRDPGDHHG